MIIETATLHVGAYTKSRDIVTHKLDSASWIHGAKHVEERVEYHSDHRDGYNPYRRMHKE